MTAPLPNCLSKSASACSSALSFSSCAPVTGAAFSVFAGFFAAMIPLPFWIPAGDAIGNRRRVSFASYRTTANSSLQGEHASFS